MYIILISEYAHFESNYCRMGGEADAWCYTTDTNTEWDWCGVPYCCMYRFQQFEISCVVFYVQCLLKKQYILSGSHFICLFKLHNYLKIVSDVC